MTLKRQLFIASVLMLLIPWAGMTFVLELDTALRDQARQQLSLQARRLAEQAGDALLGAPVIGSDTPILYASDTLAPLTLDGYLGDWPGFQEDGADTHASLWQPTNDPTLRWRAARDGRWLYLLIHRQQPPTFYQPDRPTAPHDELALRLDPPATRVDASADARRWRLRPLGFGRLYGHQGGDTGQPGPPDYRVEGVWQVAAGGWQLELRMPAPAPYSRLDLRLITDEGDRAPAGAGRLLFGPDAPLQRALARQLAPGQRARVVEPSGWVVADAGGPVAAASPEFDQLSPGQILEQTTLNALRWLVRRVQPTPRPLAGDDRRLAIDTLPDPGLVRHTDDSRWLLARAPVDGDRTLVLEQSIDQLLTVSGTTLGSVIARSLLITLTLTLALLGYASWLSWRITRLQRLINDTVDDDGRITGTLPPARGRDELAQLQDQFGQMVQRLGGYHDYLEAFSRRLSHELKTPVAVIRSSLENLQHITGDDASRPYLERAASATERLRRILNGMSEAARLEQSFDQAERETFDLARVVSEATAAYQSLDDRHRLAYQGPATGATLLGSPEHLVQLLDKLVDNARDFTPEGGRIEVALTDAPAGWQLSVFNEGSRLPGPASASIFDPFVSHRAGGGEGHLGQGLLIVRLIAAYHGGEVDAVNEPGGVRFRVTFPNEADTPGGDHRNRPSPEN
ncbi:ATP-binding protein [Marinobacter sp. C2H3]|uniref:ATP-binding protein n=1 Tax=Marinobacter sp. C2H3 TaxID=3119003 RepID=UPI00300ED9E4